MEATKSGRGKPDSCGIDDGMAASCPEAQQPINGRIGVVKLEVVPERERMPADVRDRFRSDFC
jgi:hypothetical protein